MRTFLIIIVFFCAVLITWSKGLLDPNTVHKGDHKVELFRNYVIIDTKTSIMPFIWLKIRFNYDHTFYTDVSDSLYYGGIWKISNDTLYAIGDWSDIFLSDRYDSLLESHTPVPPAKDYPRYDIRGINSPHLRDARDSVFHKNVSVFKISEDKATLTAIRDNLGGIGFAVSDSMFYNLPISDTRPLEDIISWNKKKLSDSKNFLVKDIISIENHIMIIIVEKDGVLFNIANPSFFFGENLRPDQKKDNSWMDSAQIGDSIKLDVFRPGSLYIETDSISIMDSESKWYWFANPIKK